MSWCFFLPGVDIWCQTSPRFWVWSVVPRGKKPHLLLTPAGYEGDLLLGVVVDGLGDGLQPLVALRGRAGRQDEGSLHALDVQLVLIGLLARLAHLQESDNK